MKGFKHTAFAFISLAYKNIQEMFPDHNPILHHTAESARPGDSVFHDGICTVEDALTLLEKYLDNGSEWFVASSSRKDGRFTIEMPFNIGKVSNSPPLPQEEYLIVRDHYGLMPSGKTQATLEETEKITIILTPERKNPDDEIKYVLASIYPGEPGPEGNWDGLKEGNTIRGEELIKRGITRVKQIPNADVSKHL